MVSPELSTMRTVLQNVDSQFTLAVSIQHITDFKCLNMTVTGFEDQIKLSICTRLLQHREIRSSLSQTGKTRNLLENILKYFWTGNLPSTQDNLKVLETKLCSRVVDHFYDLFSISVVNFGLVD